MTPEPAERGPIFPDDATFGPLGFTRAQFEADSYLWHRGDDVWCSLMIARTPGRGAFRELLRGLEGAGYRVVVPNPLPLMREILVRWGFVCVAVTLDGDEWARPPAGSRARW